MSDENKHTPGPWKVGRTARFINGAALAYVSVQPETPDPETMGPLAMASGEYHVCRMTHTGNEAAISLHLANARLIAAAPETTQALEDLLRLFEEIDGGQNDDAPEFVAARAAIAKARGAA